MSGKFLKVFASRALIFFLSFTPASWAAAGKNFQVKGADSLIPLGKSWAEAFSQKNPDITFEISGGGSDKALQEILSAKCDLVQSSRNITDEEKAKAKKGWFEIKKTAFGYGGVAVVTHLGNPVTQLTADQIADIFTGKIKNWKEVGGEDQDILVLSRERSTEAATFFTEHFLRHLEQKKEAGEKATESLKAEASKGSENDVKKDAAKIIEEIKTEIPTEPVVELTSSALTLTSEQAILDELKGNPYAIAYVELGHTSSDIRALAVGKTPQGPFIAPSVDAVIDDSYALGRSFYWMTRGEPKKEIKKFIEYALSDEGQAELKTHGFIPLKKSDSSESKV